MTQEESQGFSETGLSCDDCGSSDARAVNDLGWSHCFSCGKRRPPEDQAPRKPSRARPRPSDLIPASDIVYQALDARGLTQEAGAHMGYGTSMAKHPKTGDLEPCHVAQYYRDGQVVAQKLRFSDKAFVILGVAKAMGLFGSQKWTRGARLIVTEGEVDAVSVAQVTGLKTAVVSLPNGAGSAAKVLAKETEYLSRFDQVVLWFDNDKEGRRATEECIEILEPGKVLVVQSPRDAKDANDLLKAKRSKDMVSAIYQARPYRPDNLMAGADLKARVKTVKRDVVAFPWGYQSLDEKTRGIRKREVTVLVAGAKAGKSTVVREVQYRMARDGEAFAAFMLEESVEDTALALVSIHMQRRLHLEDPAVLDSPEFDRAYDESAGLPHVHLYDNRGALDLDILETKIRHAVRSLGVGWVFLDNITSMMAGSETEDERRAIDAVMMRMAKVAIELNVGVVIVCHLRRPEGERGYENGKEVTANALRGSGGILAFSNTVVAFERNQQHETKSNLIKVRVLACRFTGETGFAGYLEYDKETGLLDDIRAEDVD